MYWKGWTFLNFGDPMGTGVSTWWGCTYLSIYLSLFIFIRRCIFYFSVYFSIYEGMPKNSRIDPVTKINITEMWFSGTDSAKLFSTMSLIYLSLFISPIEIPIDRNRKHIDRIKASLFKVTNIEGNWMTLGLQLQPLDISGVNKNKY